LTYIRLRRAMIKEPIPKAIAANEAIYFRKVVNAHAPRTIKKVDMEDSRRNVLIQLADMAARSTGLSAGQREGKH
jgi:hypothetical protein